MSRVEYLIVELDSSLTRAKLELTPIGGRVLKCVRTSNSIRQMDMWLEFELEIELDSFVSLPEFDSFITNESSLYELVQINLNKNR